MNTHSHLFVLLLVYCYKRVGWWTRKNARFRSRYVQFYYYPPSVRAKMFQAASYVYVNLNVLLLKRR